MIVSLMTGNKSHRSYRAIALSPDIIASITLLDPVEMDGEHSCLVSLKQSIATGLQEDGKPEVQNVFVVSGNIHEIATAAGLDPENELLNPKKF